MDWTQILTAFLGLAGVSAGVVFTFKAKRTEITKSNEQAMIDQLQQQQDTQDLRLKDMEAKVDKLLKRDTLSRQFIWQLITHINTGVGPPAPEWPVDLL